jgi:hypothetical protein
MPIDARAAAQWRTQVGRQAQAIQASVEVARAAAQVWTISAQ